MCNLSPNEGISLLCFKWLKWYPCLNLMIYLYHATVSPVFVLSKVFEKIIYDRFIELLETCKYFTKSQFGSGKFRSTYMALMDRFITALENCEPVIGILFFFQRPLDVIDQEVLLKGAPLWYQRNSLQIVSKLLINRKQYRSYNGKSPRKFIECGVPQGLNMGPMLFSMYIDNLRCDHILLLSSL